MSRTTASDQVEADAETPADAEVQAADAPPAEESPNYALTSYDLPTPMNPEPQTTPEECEILTGGTPEARQRLVQAFEADDEVVLHSESSVLGGVGTTVDAVYKVIKPSDQQPGDILWKIKPEVVVIRGPIAKIVSTNA